MTWVKDVFSNKSNELMEQEQILYQLREAQNASMEIGDLLSQTANSGPDTQQMQYLNELNSRVGGFLQRLRQRIDREMQF